MASTGLAGPFILSDEKIDSVVTRVKPGTYVLGRINSDNIFIVKYVGRSDDNLNKRLHDWVGQYPNFKASYFDSAKSAYEKECKIYHNFGDNELLDNEIHPACPEGTYWRCPKCGK